MHKFVICTVFFLLISISTDEIFGQNETIQIETNRPISQPESTSPKSFSPLSELPTIASICVNIALVAIVLLTLRQTGKHFFSINRPWINIRIGKVIEEDYLEVIVKNHGKLAAENMNITFKNLSEEESKVKNGHLPTQIMMPSQEDCVLLDVVKTTVGRGGNQPEKSGDLLHSYHVEITITFSYGRQNKKVVFEVADDKYTSSSGVNIITTYID